MIKSLLLLVMIMITPDEVIFRKQKFKKDFGRNVRDTKKALIADLTEHYPLITIKVHFSTEIQDNKEPLYGEPLFYGSGSMAVNFLKSQISEADARGIFRELKYPGFIICDDGDKVQWLLFSYFEQYENQPFHGLKGADRCISMFESFFAEFEKMPNAKEQYVNALADLTQQNDK